MANDSQLETLRAYTDNFALQAQDTSTNYLMEKLFLIWLHCKTIPANWIPADNRFKGSPYIRREFDLSYVIALEHPDPIPGVVLMRRSHL